MIEDTQIVVNTGPDLLSVWFEPWGILHSLPPGEAFQVIGRNLQPGRLEVLVSDASVAVYGWPGSTLQVFHRDLLVDDINIVFPPLPPGMSTRRFVEFMLGGPGGPLPVTDPV